MIGCFVALVCLCAARFVMADAGDNDPANVRRLPKPGVEPSAEQRQQLEAGLSALRQAMERIPRDSPAIVKLLPDVEIYYKAVEDALHYQEFFTPQEIDEGIKLLRVGRERAEQLAERKAPWADATGLVVRGYRSRIDGSVQPYGLVVPASYTDRGPGRFRLDLWFHGRGETLSENNFIRDRSANVGTFAPPDTIVLHPYGRYNNAFKFAGEVDVLEALDSVRERYRVDDDRIAARGFSMGGAAAWQFAVHYSDRWFAANPGAGFSETPEFLRFFQKQTLDPTPFEKQLWHWYDCTDWALNLKHCPTVAYSGDQDVQKQAADIMAEALRKEGIELRHVIGINTKHSYSPDARLEVDRRMASLAEIGRDRFPLSIDFVTYTLKYNRMHWLTIDGLAEHWTEARVTAEIGSSGAEQLRLDTGNVTALTVDFPAGRAPFALRQPVTIVVDGQRLTADRPRSDGSWSCSLARDGETWRVGRLPDRLRKRHDLQGPVDDAFMDSFLFVRPTGPPWPGRASAWARGEMERAIEQWRRHFRGTVRIRDDREVTETEMAESHLILWGDPSSNRLLGRIQSQLPITWTSEEIVAAEQRFDGADHGLIMIYPNPLNQGRYVVLNSGFTFREFAHLNNARQVPMLPDWAVVDLRQPPNSVWPGRIAAADFFDEYWKLRD
jgi:acetyl esterase/lipase